MIEFKRMPFSSDKLNRNLSLLMIKNMRGSGNIGKERISARKSAVDGLHGEKNQDSNASKFRSSARKR